MDSPKFVIGGLIGALSFCFVMFNVWLWDIIPESTMVEFSNGHFLLFKWRISNSFLMAIPAVAAMLGGGLIYVAITDRKRNQVSRILSSKEEPRKNKPLFPRLGG